MCTQLRYIPTVTAIDMQIVCDLTSNVHVHVPCSQFGDYSQLTGQMLTDG